MHNLIKTITARTFIATANALAAYAGFAMRKPITSATDGTPLYGHDHWTDALCGSLEDRADKINKDLRARAALAAGDRLLAKDIFKGRA